MKAQQLSNILRDLADPAVAEHSRRFFKTGPRGYGNGDKFLGIRVPVLRRHAKKFHGMALEGIQPLLKSPFHEERLCALLLLVHAFTRGDETIKAAVYRTYRANIPTINNWDMVDISAPAGA